jgi:protoporphyrinogen IX oxidase
VGTLYFWLKVFHITAMTIWFSALLFLPRLFVHDARGVAADAAHARALGRTLYFRLMTPAAIVMIGLGLALIGFGFDGAWLPMKLILVSGLVGLHLYYGHLLQAVEEGNPSHGPRLLRLIHWAPLVLLLAIAALTAAKPRMLPML